MNELCIFQRSLLTVRGGSPPIWFLIALVRRETSTVSSHAKESVFCIYSSCVFLKLNFSCVG